MSRTSKTGLGLVLGALIAGTPALSHGTVTAAVLEQGQSQGSTSSTTSGTSSTTESTTGTTSATSTTEARTSRTAADDLGDRIERAWEANAALKDADIEANVEDGRVVLEGEVPNAQARETAERLAKRVKGVKTVDNRIAVRMTAAGDREGSGGRVVAEDARDATETAVEKTGSAIGTAAEATRDAVVTGARKTADAVTAVPDKVDETWITTKIASKINADDALEHVDVDVKVKGNVVTISGNVPSPALRDRVLRIARETEGVERVVDQMTVTSGAQR